MMKRASVLVVVVAFCSTLAPAHAGNACQEGLCPEAVINETACEAAGIYLDTLGLTIASSESRQQSGDPDDSATILNANQIGVSAVAVETTCESKHIEVAVDMWSCGTSRVVGLQISTGLLHIVADELVVTACAAYGNGAVSGSSASFVGLKILAPGNATLVDIVPNNTMIMLPAGLGTLYLDETSSTVVRECTFERANSLRLESPILGTVIVGSAAVNACTILPQ